MPGYTSQPKTVHRSRMINVDGVKTHYLEAGEGPTIVLLHSGEFGGCAEISWEYLIPLLAPRYHVVAPDWLGFGLTDKVHDFSGKTQRMVAHLVRFLQAVCIEHAHFAGNSMGASLLLQLAAERPARLQIDKLISIAGGGFAPLNEQRRCLLDYDGSSAAMRKMISAVFFDQAWSNDDEYIAKRQGFALMPGAWESVAAARLHRPDVTPRSAFGHVDETAYERVTAPTLIIAGAEDRLRLPGYTDDMCKRIPNNRLVMLAGCGHCPNIEAAEPVGAAVVQFLE